MMKKLGIVVMAGLFSVSVAGLSFADEKKHDAAPAATATKEEAKKDEKTATKKAAKKADKKAAEAPAAGAPASAPAPAPAKK